ncbi:MAG TPA: hypothetical protein VHM88_26355 [Candidatus Acidoferrales bacterium]|nr:hypothetical protein [Candidatus Acidoferrales bacterium]
MRQIAQVMRIAVAVLMASTLLSLPLGTPASAQIASPDRNAVSISAAFFSGAPVYQFGFSHSLNPALDFTAFYAYQSVSGTSAGLLDAGIRYHLPLPAPGVDVFLGAGLANVSAGAPGFGSASAWGASVGGGASVRLGPTLTGYASGSEFLFSGASNAVIDLGLMLQFAPLLSGQLGWIQYGGSGAAYLGLNLRFPL